MHTGAIAPGSKRSPRPCGIDHATLTYIQLYLARTWQRTEAQVEGEENGIDTTCSEYMNAYTSLVKADHAIMSFTHICVVTI